jgi:acyl-CoA synthetase (AMP-forming)/AMP-acid ligase II
MSRTLTPLRLLRQARRVHGGKDAIACGDARLTYAEYAERVDRLSNALLGLGVRRGDRVAWLGANCHRLLEAYYGVVQTGAVLVPLNIRLKPAELAFILRDSGAVALFHDRDLAPVVDELGDAPALRHRLLLERDYEPLLAAAPAAFETPADLGDDDLAELFYTSGTTAEPKGVMMTHRGLYLHALQVMGALGTKEGDVQLHTIPLFHVNGWGAPHTITGVGARHVVLRRFEPLAVLEIVERERVTHFSMVPTMASALLQEASLSRFDLSSLEFILLGGAAASPTLVGELERKLGCRCYAGYGLTEALPVCTIAFLKESLRGLPPEERWRRQAMAGYPIPGVEVEIVDGDDRFLPHDGASVGEVVIRADSVMAGYWQRPDETARAIRDGWLHSGDMAVVDPEGYLQIVDRAKDIIVSGGENISSLEVEKAIAAHEAVLECAVVPVPDDRWGEVGKALVVLRAGAATSEQAILEHCRARLAGFKVPKSLEIVGALPKGGTGKIQKREIRERYWLGHSRRVH